MVLPNISLASIINAPTVNAGAGGWETTLNDFLKLQRQDHRFGALARKANLAFPDTNAIEITACPAGYQAAVIFVLVRKANADPISSTTELTFGVDDDPSADDWNAGVEIDDLQNGGFAIITPFATLNPFNQPSSGFLTGNIPLLDGDDSPSTSSFWVRSVSSPLPPNLDITAYGMVWENV